MTVQITANGLDRLRRYIENWPKIAQQAATLAINQTADRGGLKMLRSEMRSEIAFPSGYLEDPKRFGVTKRARKDDLEAIITGRDRPTSLARFTTTRGKSPSVRVNPQRTRTLSRAFIIRLPAGKAPVGENFNLGLAIRLRPGEKIDNKKVQFQPGPGGLYLLYGPSVGQVFRTVAAGAVPEIETLLVDEFKRQFARLGRDA